MKDLFLVEPLEQRSLFSVTIDPSIPGPPFLEVNAGQLSLFLGPGSSATAKMVLNVDNAVGTHVGQLIGSDVPG